MLAQSHALGPDDPHEIKNNNVNNRIEVFIEILC